MAAGVQSLNVDVERQQSPASEGPRSQHRPFLLGVLFGGLAVGGFVALASPGRAEAKFVATPVGVASVGSTSAATDALRLPGQATSHMTGPMMAADGGYDLLPGRREALATGAAGFAAGVGLLGGASAANAEKQDYLSLKLGGDQKTVDVNNAKYENVYSILQGFDEGAAKKLAANAPYKGLTDMYSRAGLSSSETTAVKKYEQQLLFGNPAGKYTIDKSKYDGLYK